jgi:hypothetical protein
MSVIGKPDRQLWYELNTPTEEPQEGETSFSLHPSNYLKFLFGDIIEQLLVFLIRESGHTITHEQEEVEIRGVLGHTDGVIDGIPADIKSASSYQFQTKFKGGQLLHDKPEADPFGYKGQLAGYREELIKMYPDEIDPDRVAWLAMNKETGELWVLEADVMQLSNADQRIEHLQEILKDPEPPEDKCYEDTPEGKSGNRVIHKQCNWCKFKHQCWASSNSGEGLRSFKYANGIKYFTQVSKTPNVQEVTKDD